MEQIIIVEQQKQKPKTGVQVASFVLGLIGFFMSFALYMGAIFYTVLNAIAIDSGNGQLSGGLAGVVFGGVICIICLTAFILGVVGLVKSIKKATRTVKGIIFSALGIDFAVAGCVFAFLSGAVATVINAVLPQLMNSLH